MKVLEFLVAFVFLGIVPPVLLLKLATPWPLGSILMYWTPVAAAAVPLGVLVLKKKRVL
ncbi:hypothetical protein [Geomesophilobacter sediminis]|uniref:Uncharacterized protein n=1 Tax=Geomesophilobacter sediminis TaxID=2798584 RepID=A0A8J7LXM5_9BACT|nr:hypothetical protein [Geomesophilobacter sediminis]MBJ6723361.1 hypothetical protein [Geomesophilobacter sediminis]